MLAAGAADRHRQIAAVVAHIAGQPVGNESTDVLDHPSDIGLALEELDDLGILSGQRTQLRVVVRVGQAAHVEHQVGVERNAVLEAERLEQQGQALSLIHI